jgi:hypothetical protein
MPDEISDVSSGESAPSVDSSTVGSSPTQDATLVTNEQEGASAVPEAPFQVPETDDDLAAQRGQPYYEGLLNLRNAYRELKGTHDGLQEQYSQYYEPIAQQVEQLGGIQTASAAVDLVSKLFTPQIDQFGQQVVDPNTGLPVTSTSDFVQTLASENWDTVLDMTEHILSLPTANGQPLIAEVCRRVLGIDPDKLDLYRQIGSPADAARMGLLDIDPVELEDLPERYHGVYARLNALQREAVQDPNLAQITREQMLEQYAQAQKWEDFRQSQETEIARQQQQREQQYAQQVEAHGEQSANALWNTYASGFQQDLGQIQWSADPSASQRVNEFVLRGVASYVMEDPKVSPLYQQAYELIRQASRYEAMGNRMQANQARVRAANVSQQVAAHARIYMTQMVGDLQAARGMASTSGANGARPVVSGNGRNGPGAGNGQPRPMNPDLKFGSKEYLDDVFARANR